jgi:hypothetical protein
MRLLIAVFMLLFVAGCQSSEVTKVLTQSDSLNIKFNNSPLDNLTTDKKAIQDLARFVGGREKKLPLECEVKPSGMIFFYQKGKLYQQVTFTDLSQKCRYFITQLNGQTVYTEVSNEAADFLATIQKGKSTY